MKSSRLEDFAVEVAEALLWTMLGIAMVILAPLWLPAYLVRRLWRLRQR